MNPALDRVLQLVAEGKLSALDAAPILDALEGSAATGAPGASSAPGQSHESGAGVRRTARTARIEIFEGGKRRVNLRVPISLGRFALARVPGLSAERIDEVEEAVATGQLGPILDIEDDDGDGVRIVLE